MFYCDPALVLKFGWTLAVMSRNMTNISIVSLSLHASLSLMVLNLQLDYEEDLIYNTSMLSAT